MADPAVHVPELGAQVWVERDATRAEIDVLMARAVDCGLRQVRLFLMWPWIEAERGTWDFATFDAAFDSAASHGLSAKATLTANSGPWWLGTGGVLHSHTTLLATDHLSAVLAYVRACVGRYREHPALGQWILWNEPHNLPHEWYSEGDPSRALWPAMLKERYGDIDELNRRWLTGYPSFAEVPAIRDIHHPAHGLTPWRSFEPLLDDCELRAATLVHDLRLIGEAVRELDPQTPLCINPNLTLLNHAEAGYDLAALAETSDVLGATFHAPWTFAFAPRRHHLPLTLAGLSLLQHVPGAARVEITEFQLGNAYLAGNRPLGVSPGQVAAGYLLPILAGAESVTGWDLNTRSHGYEAGEWSLLDATDQPTPRADAVRRVPAVLADLRERIGQWRPEQPQVWVVVSDVSLAVQYAHGELQQQNDPGRGRHEAIQGASLLVAYLRTMGIAAAMVPRSALSGRDLPRVVIASHVVAWSTQFAEQLLDAAKNGVTVLLDGTCGQYDERGTLHRPWPGGLRPAGVQTNGLLPRSDGVADWPLRLMDLPAGCFPTVRAESDYAADAGWSMLGELRVDAPAHVPAAWLRDYGAGRVLHVVGVLATAALHADSEPAVRYLLARACDRTRRSCVPAGTRTSVVRVDGASGTAFGIWTDPESDATAEARLAVPPGRYTDIWNGTEFDHRGPGDLVLRTDDGICLLVSRSAADGGR